MVDLPADAGQPASSEAPLTVAEAAKSFLKRLETRDDSGRDRDIQGRFVAPATGAEPLPEAKAAETPDDPDLAALAASEGQEAPPEAGQPDQGPPIEPPASWTAEQRAEFAKLPAELQRSLSAAQKSRDEGIQRRIQAAEEKAATELQQANALRTEYEQRLQQTQDAISGQIMAEFADIKNIDDVQRMANADPLRFIKFQGQIAKLQNHQQQMQQARERQAQEQQRSFATFAEQSDTKFAEEFPEFADSTKGPQLRGQVAQYMRDQGLDDAMIDALWNGRQTLSLRHPLAQRLLYLGMRMDKALKAQKERKPPPPDAKPRPVLRPGVVAPRGSSNEAQIKSLDQQLDKTQSLDSAAALLTAKRAALRR